MFLQQLNNFQLVGLAIVIAYLVTTLLAILLNGLHDLGQNLADKVDEYEKKEKK